MGFKLETFIDTDTEERFLKLSVRESLTSLRTSEFPDDVTTEPLNTQVPIDFSEWYFIVATYNPSIDEGNSTHHPSDPDYWRGNVNTDGTYTHHSTYGNKCKVEIISKTDLLRARGFQS